MATINTGHGSKVLDLEVDAFTAKAFIHPVIGKIISDCVLNDGEVVSFIRKAWKSHYGKVRIMQLRDNLYLFSFEDAAFAEKVVQDGPWVVMGHFLCLHPWGAHKDLEEIRNLTRVPIWVQVYGLLLDQMTEKNAGFIGDSIGEFIKLDQQSLWHSKNPGFLRIQVYLDCSAILKADLWVRREDQEKYLIYFKYENLPEFCFHCGRLGHLVGVCEDKGVALALPHQPRFGPWLRAITESTNFEMKHHVVDISEKGDNCIDTDKLLAANKKSEDEQCGPFQAIVILIGFICFIVGVVVSVEFVGKFLLHFFTKYM